MNFKGKQQYIPLVILLSVALYLINCLSLNGINTIASINYSTVKTDSDTLNDYIVDIDFSYTTKLKGVMIKSLEQSIALLDDYTSYYNHIEHVNTLSEESYNKLLLKIHNDIEQSKKFDNLKREGDKYSINDIVVENVQNTVRFYREQLVELVNTNTIAEGNQNQIDTSTYNLIVKDLNAREFINNLYYLMIIGYIIASHLFIYGTPIERLEYQLSLDRLLKENMEEQADDREHTND